MHSGIIGNDLVSHKCPLKTRTLLEHSSDVFKPLKKGLTVVFESGQSSIDSNLKKSAIFVTF